MSATSLYHAEGQGKSRGKTLRKLPTRPVVYAFLDVNLRPVYVGRTMNMRRRMIQHRSGAVWWPRVDYLTWWNCPPDADLKAAERHAIFALCPPYNDQCTYHFGRVLFERWRAKGRGPFQVPLPRRFYGHIDRWIADVIDRKPNNIMTMAAIAEVEALRAGRRA